MTTTTDDATFDIDIACSLTANELVERGEAFAHLFADAEAVAELATGYALRFPNRDAWIERAVELIIAERTCCPFFSFTLAFEPNGGPVWLHVEGPGQVKAFIREQMVPAHLKGSSDSRVTPSEWRSDRVDRDGPSRHVGADARGHSCVPGCG